MLAFALWRRTTGGGLGALLRNLAAPRADTLARRHIEAIETVEGGHAVRLSGFSEPLYLAGLDDLDMLYQVVAEQRLPWMWHFYEIPETSIRPGDVVFDCGAAEGLFSFLVRDRAAQVVAFEPSPHYAVALARTFPAGGNVTVVAAALSDRVGTAYLSDCAMMSQISDAPDGTEVRVTTVDAFAAESGIIPTYLKADLEGSELAMLKGAAETIRAHKPRIAITTYHHSGDAERLRGCLAELRPDYRFHEKGIEQYWGEPVMLHAW